MSTSSLSQNREVVKRNVSLPMVGKDHKLGSPGLFLSLSQIREVVKRNVSLPMVGKDHMLG